MSIRNYDELFTSAYSQVLRAGKKVKYFDASWQNFINGNRGWPSVVKEISDAVPDVKIVIWRFEDYIKDPSQYLEMFSGVSVENHQDWVYPDFTRRLSESQIAAIEDRRLNWLGLNQVRKKKLEGIIKNVVAEGVFSPVSEPDKEASLKRYVNDCDLLSNVNNVTFMNI